jgi:hypothetical protein
MYTCDHWREKIWDDLFGLIEGGESEALHLHLTACDACQAERTAAIAQHRLVAEAARLKIDIPLFTAPLVENQQSVSHSHYPQNAAGKRRVRALPWLAAAAALLLLTGLPFGVHHYGRARYNAAWRTAEHNLDQIVQDREGHHARAQTAQANLIRETQAKHLRLRVLGPAAYQLGAVNPYQVWVSDFEGHPADAPVKARLMNANKALVLEPKKSLGKGEWLVELPANLPFGPESTPRLELAVRDQADPAALGTYLRVLEPAYRTHLVIDKAVYHTGDTVYFRSLTLERFGLRVPDRQFTAIYTLSDIRGKDLHTLRGLTWKGGIGGGAFEVSPNWPSGEYRLTVADAENRFPPVTRRLWLRAAAPLAPGQGEKSTRNPTTPDGLEVEFFPEGGDLVSGLESRVYFRVRTPQGQTAALQGVILDSHDREVAAVQTARPVSQGDVELGLGVFMLRPGLGERYRLRINSPRNLDIRGAFPIVQEKGVALNLPAAVAGPGEPIRAILQWTGPVQDLVVALFCQGRLAAQEFVTAKPGSTELRLTPTAPCSGVMRITVFEERQGQLWPLAERLAYRRPEGQLKLSVKADREDYAPGERVKLTIGSRNEKGLLEPSWVLVSVVDQTALSRRTDSSQTALPAYFYLTSELQQPEDIEQADILVSDSPEAATALDLFLGTQGWRRFVEQEGDPNQGTVHLANSGVTHTARDMGIPAIVKLDNTEEVGLRYATALTQASIDLQDTLIRRDKELATEGAERLQAARIAARELDAYEERAGALIELGLGVGGVVLFLAGCLLLAVGLLRLLGRMLSRPQKTLPPPSNPDRTAKAWHPLPSRAYLAGAFAALSLCTLMLLRSPGGWDRSRSAIDLTKLARYAARLDKRLEFAISLPKEQALVSNQALSKRRGPLLPDASAKENATSASKELAETATQRDNAGPVSSNPRPRIGFIGVGRGEKPPPSLFENKSGPPPRLPVRAYAYSTPSGPPVGNELPDTILWQPILFAENGAAEVDFTLPVKAAAYRIHAQGHSAVGRLGAVRENLRCRQKAAGRAN